MEEKEIIRLEGCTRINVTYTPLAILTIIFIFSFIVTVIIYLITITTDYNLVSIIISGFFNSIS